METASETSGWSIAAAERETGLSKDTLRIWERRYGFPCPTRTLHGERLYSDQDMVKLRLAARLLDKGMRPGKILALPIADLEQLSGGAGAARSAQQDFALYLLKTRNGAELRRELNHALMRDGLYRFVTETAAPLSALVGDVWMRGEIRIFEEHLFTEQLTGVLRNALAQVPTAGGTPRVLLTTLPLEQHGLGLLMAEALFALEGAECVALGTQTPVSEVVAAAVAKQADAVALSFSANFAANKVGDSLRLLREALPPGIALWCGGAGTARGARLPEGATRIDGLEAIGQAVSDWLKSSGAPDLREG